MKKSRFADSEDRKAAHDRGRVSIVSSKGGGEDRSERAGLQVNRMPASQCMIGEKVQFVT